MQYLTLVLQQSGRSHCLGKPQERGSRESTFMTRRVGHEMDSGSHRVCEPLPEPDRYCWTSSPLPYKHIHKHTSHTHTHAHALRKKTITGRPSNEDLHIGLASICNAHSKQHVWRSINSTCHHTRGSPGLTTPTLRCVTKTYCTYPPFSDTASITDSPRLGSIATHLAPPTHHTPPKAPTANTPQHTRIPPSPDTPGVTTSSKQSS